MRTIELCGKAYPLTYSAGVACAVDDKYDGNVDEMLKALSSDRLGDRLRVIAWLAAEMMASAARRSSIERGAAAEATPDEAQLLDLLTLRDLPTVQAAVIGAMTDDTRRTVEADASKNARATPPGP